jgi:small subunit ribosomal protein S17
MAEENETTEDEAPEAAAEETPEATPAEEAPAEQAEEPAEQAEEPAEQAVEPAAADQGEADPGTPGREAEEVPGSDSAEEAAEALSPKAQRKLERSRHTGEARPQREPEERAAERAAKRAKAAAARRRSRARARSKHQPGEGTPPAERAAGSKKVRQGTVISDKADKTITVRIEVVRRHPVYEKVVRRTATIHAHDEANDANAGDVVRVVESRPMSRTKRWRLVEVLERAR